MLVDADLVLRDAARGFFECARYVDDGA
jgi:hypothetical protein